MDGPFSSMSSVASSLMRVPSDFKATRVGIPETLYFFFSLWLNSLSENRTWAKNCVLKIIQTFHLKKKGFQL